MSTLTLIIMMVLIAIIIVLHIRLTKSEALTDKYQAQLFMKEQQSDADQNVIRDLKNKLIDFEDLEASEKDLTQIQEGGAEVLGNEEFWKRVDQPVDYPK